MNRVHKQSNQEKMARAIHAHVVSIYSAPAFKRLHSSRERCKRYFAECPENGELNAFVAAFLRSFNKQGLEELKPSGIKTFETTWDGKTGIEAQLRLVGNGKRFIIYTFLEKQPACRASNGKPEFKCILRPYTSEIERRLRREVRRREPLYENPFGPFADILHPDPSMPGYSEFMSALVAIRNAHLLDIPCEKGELIFDSKNELLTYYLPSKRYEKERYVFFPGARKLYLKRDNSPLLIRTRSQVPQELIDAMDRFHSRMWGAPEFSPVYKVSHAFQEFMNSLE